MDGKLLYTNISNLEGISAVRAAYDSHQKSIVTKVIITFPAVTLTLNDFMLNCKNYLQITGCVMGTASTPSYAKISLERFEKKHIYSFIKDKVELYLRYADGISFHWEGHVRKTEKFH